MLDANKIYNSIILFQKNPQKEIPVLDDDGFFLGESNAILQYICDKYKPDSNLYPKDPQIRYGNSKFNNAQYFYVIL